MVARGGVQRTAVREQLALAVLMARWCARNSWRSSNRLGSGTGDGRSSSGLVLCREKSVVADGDELRPPW
jgi:hypothetical protein